MKPFVTPAALMVLRKTLTSYHHLDQDAHGVGVSGCLDLAWRGWLEELLRDYAVTQDSTLKQPFRSAGTRKTLRRAALVFLVFQPFAMI
jgi:hypothetical protein